MGKYTADGKILMLDALRGTNPSTEVTHAGLFDAATPLTAVTGAQSTDLFTKTSHGLANGDLVILTELTGGAGEFRAGNAGNGDENAEALFVIASTANTFQLSRRPAGSAVLFTVDISAVTVTKLVEIAGGSPAYARKAIAFNAPVDPGTMDDSTNGAIFDVPAGASVDYAGYFSAVTAGVLQVLDKLTTETFGGQGTYTLTDVDFDLLAA